MCDYKAQLILIRPEDSPFVCIPFPFLPFPFFTFTCPSLIVTFPTHSHLHYLSFIVTSPLSAFPYSSIHALPFPSFFTTLIFFLSPLCLLFNLLHIPIFLCTSLPSSLLPYLLHFPSSTYFLFIYHVYHLLSLLPVIRLYTSYSIVIPSSFSSIFIFPLSSASVSSLNPFVTFQLPHH